MRDQVCNLMRWTMLAGLLRVLAACDDGPAALDATVGIPDGGDADASAETDWVEADCSSGSSPLVLAHVPFKRKLDYAALLGTFPGGVLSATGAFPAGIQQLDAVGVPCASARNPMQCMAMLAELEAPADICVAERACMPFMVTTEGDKVERVDISAELVMLFGRVDSAPKAELVAAFNGHTLACPLASGGQYLSGTQALRDEDGFQVRTEWQVCNAPAFAETLHVDADGTLTALDNRIVGPTICFSEP